MPNYLFILPHLLLFAIFLAYPIFRGLQISLYDWKIMLPLSEQRFIGVENFKALMKDPLWWKVLGNTVKFTLMTLVANTSSP